MELERITRKSLLNKSMVEYADHAVNHVAGCSHGCLYPCYAFLQAKRNGQARSYEEWRTPKIVGNALELLEHEIPKHRKKIKTVHMCFTSDPFMYGHPEISCISVAILEKLNSAGIPCTTLTKGVYPADDIIGHGAIDNTMFGITVVTLNEEFRKQWEPGAAPIIKRIDACKALHDAGHRTWVSIEPYPTPNIIDQKLYPLLEAISFVDKIVFGRLNYNKRVSECEDFREFYNAQARLVVKFCRIHGIECYIKEGTMADDMKCEALNNSPETI